MRYQLVLSCEHAGAAIPAPYRAAFRGHAALLASHRGYDRGAHALGRALALAFGTELYACVESRLLVDTNRHPKHPRLFSEVTRELSRAERGAILRDHYQPHRQAVEAAVARGARRGQVLHLSIHSFVPVLDGKERTADLGLLYDPARPSERQLCARLAQHLGAIAPALSVRRNYPYRGVSDGFTTSLRRRLGDDRYLGIEVEMNQLHARRAAAFARPLIAALGRELGSGS
jgi:predicted N-formylglutamate amidohydrolase